MNNSVKNCEPAGFIRPVSVGMRYRTSDDVKDGFGIEQDHAESIHYLVLISIL